MARRRCARGAAYLRRADADGGDDARARRFQADTRSPTRRRTARDSGTMPSEARRRRGRHARAAAPVRRPTRPPAPAGDERGASSAPTGERRRVARRGADGERDAAAERDAASGARPAPAPDGHVKTVTRAGRRGAAAQTVDTQPRGNGRVARAGRTSARGPAALRHPRPGLTARPRATRGPSESAAPGETPPRAARQGQGPSSARPTRPRRARPRPRPTPEGEAPGQTNDRAARVGARRGAR